MASSALLSRLVWVAVVLLAILALVAVAGRLADPYGGVGPSSSDGTEAGYVQYPDLTRLHIIPGALFMVLGPLQFARRIRARYLQFHRWSGRVFVVSSVVIGVTALMMGIVMPIGGANETAATTFFSLIFLFAVVKAFVEIRHGRVRQHREWMLRAFAVGLAIATIRPIVGIFFALTDLSPREFFGIAFWLGFGVHLIAAEIWIQHTRREPATRSAKVATAL
jgi:uncharacterized membrane protein